MLPIKYEYVGNTVAAMFTQGKHYKFTPDADPAFMTTLDDSGARHDWSQAKLNDTATWKRITPPTIHEEADEKLSLARSYAEDGAFVSAARVYREVAALYARRAAEINAELGVGE